MALFGTKKEEKKDDAVAETKEVATQEVAAVSDNTPTVGGSEDITRVISAPRITEKATLGTAPNVYVFNVAPDANKKQIKEAVKRAYNVEPVKVHVTKIATKNVRNQRTGTKGTKSGGKKAYVYLKEGDKISVM